MDHNTPISFIGSGAAGAAQLLTSAADIHIWQIPFKCRVKLVGFTVTVVVSASSAPVVDFDRVPYGVIGSREAAFDTLTLTTTTAVGKTYYAKPEGKILYAGDHVIAQVSTAASSTGQGYPFMIVEYIPEEEANVSAWVKSA